MSGVVVGARDLVALTWLAEQRVISLEQLGVLLGQDRRDGEAAAVRRSGVQRVVKRWTDAGLVERWRPLDKLGVLVVPTPEAARLTGVRNVRRPGYGVVEHSLAVNDVRLSVESSGAVWVPESAVSARFGVTVKAGGHLPDGVVLASADAAAATGWAIEVERHAKSRTRTVEAIRSSLRVFAGTWYVCERAEVATAVLAARNAAGLGPADARRVVVTAGADTARVLDQGGPWSAAVAPVEPPAPQPRPMTAPITTPQPQRRPRPM